MLRHKQRNLFIVGIGRELVTRIGSNGNILIVHHAATATPPSTEVSLTPLV